MACVVLGFPLAYAIAFKAGRWQNLMLVAVIAPFFTSFLVRTLSWKLLLGDQAFITDLVNALPFLDGVRLLATPFAVITGLTYNFLPFMVLPLYASLEKIDLRLLEAGGDLYASPFTTFRLVTLPAGDARPRRRHAADLHPGRAVTTSTPSCSATRGPA